MAVITEVVHNHVFSFFKLVKTDTEAETQVLGQNSDAGIIATSHHTSTQSLTVGFNSTVKISDISRLSRQVATLFKLLKIKKTNALGMLNSFFSKFELRL